MLLTYQQNPKKTMHQFNESERVNALKKYEISDSGIDNELQEITELAALICHTPFALITLNDSEKQWVKTSADKKLPVNFYENIFCKYAIKDPDSILEIPNAAEDNRFKNNLLVKNEPFIKFYASVPLLNSKGQVLGTLTLMDIKAWKTCNCLIKRP